MGHVSLYCKRNYPYHVCIHMNRVTQYSPEIRDLIASRILCDQIREYGWLAPVLLEPCAEEAAFKFAVGSITIRTRYLIDNFTSLQSWGGILNMLQVGYQGRVGLVGNRDSVWS